MGDQTERKMEGVIEGWKKAGGFLEHHASKAFELWRMS